MPYAERGLMRRTHSCYADLAQWVLMQYCGCCYHVLRPRQNGRHFADDIFKCIFMNENIWIQIKISLKFIPKGPINNIPALVQIMAWRRPGDKPLPEPIWWLAYWRIYTLLGLNKLSTRVSAAGMLTNNYMSICLRKFQVDIGVLTCPIALKSDRRRWLYALLLNEYRPRASINKAVRHRDSWSLDTWWRHQMEALSALLAICAGNSPVTGEFPTHEGRWRGALMFFLICAWINSWVNNGEACDLKRHRAHYDVTIMNSRSQKIYVSVIWS